jgi:hypothetical protein
MIAAATRTSPAASRDEIHAGPIAKADSVCRSDQRLTRLDARSGRAARSSLTPEACSSGHHAMRVSYLILSPATRGFRDSGP